MISRDIAYHFNEVSCLGIMLVIHIQVRLVLKDHPIVTILQPISQAILFKEHPLRHECELG